MTGERPRSPWRWGAREAICHFCYLNEARWEFPTLDEDDPERPEQETGNWLACDACERLISSGRRDELAEQLAVAVSEMPSGIERDEARGLYRAWFDEFWARRDGPPVPYRFEPRADSA